MADCFHNFDLRSLFKRKAADPLTLRPACGMETSLRGPALASATELVRSVAFHS